MHRQQALVTDSHFKDIPGVKLHSTSSSPQPRNNERLRKVASPSSSESSLQESPSISHVGEFVFYGMPAGGAVKHGSSGSRHDVQKYIQNINTRVRVVCVTVVMMKNFLKVGRGTKKKPSGFSQTRTSLSCYMCFCEMSHLFTFHLEPRQTILPAVWLS